MLEEFKARLEKLEKDVEVLKKPKEGLTIGDPAGNYSIVMLANNNGAGIWIQKKGQPNTELVAIYNGFHNGPVIGLYGSKNHNALDVCLCTDTTDYNGGRIQMVGKDGKEISLTTEDFK